MEDESIIIKKSVLPWSCGPILFVRNVYGRVNGGMVCIGFGFGFGFGIGFGFGFDTGMTTTLELTN